MVETAARLELRVRRIERVRLHALASRRSQGVEARVVVAHRGLEQRQPVDSARVHGGGELEEPADPVPGRTPIEGYLGMRQHRRFDRSVRRRSRDAGRPRGAVFTLAERRFEEPEPGFGLGCFPAGGGHPLQNLYVPRVPNAGMGPEHFTFTVRQGVR